MNFHHISKDVSGERYREMVRRLLEISASFSLVLRDELDFEPESSSLLHALSPFEQKRERRDRWPGTRTFARNKPIIAYFRSSPEVLGTLCEPQSLFSWRAPRYPEDPAFYDHNSEPLFATTAHESEAWVLQRVAVKALAQLVTLRIEVIRGDAIPIILGAA
jgi:hypothetical protein